MIRSIVDVSFCMSFSMLFMSLLTSFRTAAGPICGICLNCRFEFSQNSAIRLRAKSRACLVETASQSNALQSMTHRIRRCMRSNMIPFSVRNCRRTTAKSLSAGCSMPPSCICIINEILCAVVDTVSWIGYLIKGDLLNSRRKGLSCGFIRRSLNSAAWQIIWSFDV